MKFMLLQDKDEIVLPINPEVYELNKAMGNQTIYLPELGEVNVLGKPNLSKISLNGMFPNQEYPFVEYKPVPEPQYFVNMINKFMIKGQVRLQISGTLINSIFYIDTFNFGERDGTGDIYYTIEFKEYKKVKIKTISVASKFKLDFIKLRPSTSSGSPVNPKTYTVKKGDSLWEIAKKFYGDGSKYPELKKKNNLKSNVLRVGQVLKI